MRLISLTKKNYSLKSELIVRSTLGKGLGFTEEVEGLPRREEGLRTVCRQDDPAMKLSLQ
tara:strand:- start:34 stop:213 length:180 start_codon:yes stop_codon:yes gene_type:complete